MYEFWSFEKIKLQISNFFSGPNRHPSLEKDKILKRKKGRQSFISPPSY